MAARRNLVSRARLNENLNSSPAQRRHREEEPAQPTALPPYEPPSCPLTASGRRALDELRVGHNYAKYQKHITHSKKTIPSVIAESNERLIVLNDKLAKTAEKRRRQERGDDEKTEAELEEEKFAHKYAKKVEDLTTKAEKAMRDLIDYEDELKMQDTLMSEVGEKIAAAPVPRPPPKRRPRQRQPRNEDSDEDAEQEEEEEDGQPEVPVLSVSELLKKAKEDYTREYNSKSMLQRYDNSDYGTFKKVVHESIHPGENAPKLPKASKWFPQDSTQQDGEAEESEESDDEVYISGVKDDFKCPLSLRKFQEPFTNKGCSHTYEKKTIIDFINTGGTQYTSTQNRGQRSGKQIKCVVWGCDNMLKLDEFYDDGEILHKMRRADREAAREMEEDDEEEQAPRGTQATRPEELDDDEESEAVRSRKSIARVKKERQSRGQSSAPRRAARSSDVEMDGE